MHSSSEGQSDTEYVGRGFLIVNTVSANEALPIENARVYIKGNDPQNQKEEFILFTDESGLTEITELRAPSRQLSLSPGNPAGYSSYNISVSKPGYYERELLHVPIFDGVTSLQRINMVAQTPYNSQNFNPNTPTQESEPFDTAD